MIQEPAVHTSVRTRDLAERFKALEDIQRAAFKILEDFNEEKVQLERFQQATVNILEDFDDERHRFRDVQRATLNLLEDVNAERDQFSQVQLALMNMLEDIEMERESGEQARLALHWANRELEAFSYSVSHDLQAPLRALSGYSEALMEDYADRFDADGQQYLTFIRDNALKMGQLIHDLLAFSRLGRQQMEESEIDLSQLTRSVFEECMASAGERDIRLVLHDLPPVQGDRAMMRQVLVNLIANAVKFTRPRATAVIEVGCRRQVGEPVFFVRDNGVGFEMQYASKLFGVFQRLHDVREFEGTGVGLALVQRIITRHGGRVWAQGALDQGATIFFTLPGGTSA